MATALKPVDRAAGKDWELYFKAFIKDVQADENETEDERKKRMKRLEADPVAWNSYYFPKYTYAPPAWFHKKAIKQELSDPELYVVRMWSREMAKDVVEMMITLNQVLAQKSKKEHPFLFISK